MEPLPDFESLDHLVHREVPRDCNNQRRSVGPRCVDACQATVGRRYTGASALCASCEFRRRRRALEHWSVTCSRACLAQLFTEQPV